MGRAADKALFTIDQAADFIALSRSRIYELISAGQLELGKLHGRSVIRREVLEEHLAKHYRPQNDDQAAMSKRRRSKASPRR